jgi:RNA polymerase sigma-70 factor (ECF subfamily)
MTSLDALMDSPLAEAPRTAEEARRDARPFGSEFRVFYERHFRFVYRIVSRLAGPEGDVDDLTQEIFAIAGQKLPEFEGRAKETTWLYRIAANVVSADRRKRRRQHLLSLRWLKPSADDAVAEGPDRDVERSDAHSLVRGILAEMSEKKRSVFVLFELEGLSGQEVAEIVECPLDTMWTRLFHARREFKKLLGERGYHSSADLDAIPGVAK